MKDMEIIAIAGGSLVLLFLLGSFGMGSGMMGFGMGFGIIFWVLLIALIVYLLAGKEAVKSEENSAIKILNERYARGEINQEEYLRMKEALKR